MKTIVLDTYKMKLIKETSPMELHIPEEPVFYQVFNHRVVVGIFPFFNNDNIDYLKIIKLVDDAQLSILVTKLSINPDDVSMVIKGGEVRTEVERLKSEVIDYLTNTSHFDITGVKSFNKILDKINLELPN